MLAVCAVRGFGFGLTAVAGDTLIVSLLPADRRGEGLGLFGLVTSVPGILALPAGVWLAGVGYSVVFAAAAAVSARRGGPPAPTHSHGGTDGYRPADN